MRLTLRQLQIFTAVADTGSTTAAGLIVSLAQSATSGALRELEGILAARVFDRVGKRLVLNDNGRALLPRARAMLDGAKDIEGGFATFDTSLDATPHLLVLGASTTIGNYILPALVASYLGSSPNVCVDIVIGNTSEIAAAAARLEIDIGFIEGPCHEREVQALPWLDDELVIVCGPAHPLLHEDRTARVGVKVLREQQWLLREPGSGTREAVESALLPHLNQWTRPMVLGSTEAIKQAVAVGLGIACLPLCAVRDLLALGRIAVIKTTLPRLTRPFYQIHHRQKNFSSALEHFVSHCRAI